MRDQASKQRLGELYRGVWVPHAATVAPCSRSAPEAIAARSEAALKAGDYLAEHWHEVPLVLDPGGLAVTDAQLGRRSVVGGASIYRAVQNALLACNARGLCACLRVIVEYAATSGEPKKHGIARFRRASDRRKHSLVSVVRGFVRCTRFALRADVLQFRAADHSMLGVVEKRGVGVGSRVALFAACALALMLSALSEARASCAAPVTCICQEWPNAHVFHGSVRESAGTTTRVEVHEVLAGAGLDPLSAGDVIQGVLDGPESCGVSVGSFAPGAEVLALWQGTLPDSLECPEFGECAVSRCAAWAADPAMDFACRSECVDEVRDACPSRAPRLVLVPWADNLDLGEGRTLAADSAAVFADRNACNDRLAGPAPACNDQVLVEVDDRACSVGSVGASSSDRTSAVAVWLIGFALVCGSMRARRAGRR